MAGTGTRVTQDRRDPFARSYARARQNFLEAADAAGLRVESRPHPLQGLGGEALAMDVARDGPPDAQALLVLSSGCHGVEGFAGSGVQVAALRDEEWLSHARRRGVAVLYAHALNPYGFSHLWRTTHENIDLNRNFHDFSRPLPLNEAYRDLHPLLLPNEWPPTPENTAAFQACVATMGPAALQAAVSRGPYEFPDGMFFGGTQPSWSNLAWRDALRTHGRRAARIGWIDLHTGLGLAGAGERIYAGPDDAQAIERARRWWDGAGRTPLTSIYDGSSSSAFLTGLMCFSVADECPQAEYTGMVMEYGTVPLLELTTALRGDHWLHQHPEAPPALAQAIRQRTFEVFFIDTDSWKQQVLQQAREALFQAVDGLAG